MAIAYMNQIVLREYDTQNIEVRSWDKKETLNSPGNGDAIIIPNGAREVIINMCPDGGIGKVQYTLDPYQDVIDDPDNVEWLDWDIGEVVLPAQDCFYSPVAIRQVNIAGTTKLTIVAHRD